jgi:tRNA threonylcarbamoyladenosine biosynthesis protein TsaB
MSDVLSAARWSPKDVEIIAVTVGPGSFTGLRVGVTTAKAFAYATGAEVVGVNTLDCIAQQVSEDVPLLSAVIDAQRAQVFARNYQRGATGLLEAIGETEIVDNERWLQSLATGWSVSGPALGKLAAQVPLGIKVVAAQRWQPQASAVGQVAWRRYESGGRDDLWSLVPLYLRRSAAEEKLDRPAGESKP